MIKTIPALLAALLISSAVIGQTPVNPLANPPATQPTTQPAANADAKVLIVPFTPVEPTDPDWIGRAVQQSLVADLSRGNGVPMQAVGDSAKIGTVSEAVDNGKRLDARYVIFGTYQHMEPNLRITGQIVDVSSGKVVAGLKSTGSLRDLFDMQDNLAFQAKWGLGTERLNEKALAKADESKAPGERPALQPQGPVVLSGDRYADSELSRAVADGRSLIQREDAAGQSFREQTYNYEPDYPYGYGYPYFGYGNPYFGWWWGTRTIIIDKHHHHHHHDHDRPRVQTRSDNRDFRLGVGNTMGSYPMTMQSTQRNYNTAPNRNFNQFPRNYVAPQSSPRTFNAPSGGGRMVSSPSRGAAAK